MSSSSGFQLAPDLWGLIVRNNNSAQLTNSSLKQAHIEHLLSASSWYYLIQSAQLPCFQHHSTHFTDDETGSEK